MSYFTNKYCKICKKKTLHKSVELYNWTTGHIVACEICGNVINTRD